MNVPSKEIVGWVEPRIHPSLRKAFEELAKTVEWEEVRPGVFERKIKYEGTLYRTRHWICSICRKEYTVAPSLKNDVWNEIAPNDGMMCFSCMEVTLGRKLTMDDLKENSFSWEWRYILNREKSNNA